MWPGSGESKGKHGREGEEGEERWRNGRESWTPTEVFKSLRLWLYMYRLNTCLSCKTDRWDWPKRKDFAQTVRSVAGTFWKASSRRVIKLAYNPRQPNDCLGQTASACNQLSPYATSPSNRAYCYSEFGASSLTVTVVIDSTYHSYSLTVCQVDVTGLADCIGKYTLYRKELMHNWTNFVICLPILIPFRI